MNYTRPKTHLIIQSYPEKNNDRKNELYDTLTNNLNNNSIDLIHDIQEPNVNLPHNIKNNNKIRITQIDVTKTKHTTSISEFFSRSMKYSIITSNILKHIHSELIKKNNTRRKLEKLSRLLEDKLKYRLTFKYVFEYIKSNIPVGDVVIIANNDIIISNDNYWLNIDRDLFSIDPNIVICLSRYEIDQNKKPLNTIFNPCCLDVFCFKNNGKEINDINFTVGNCPSVDVAMVNRFFKAGYRVFNDPIIYKVYHNDIVRKRTTNTMILNESTDMCLPGKDDNGNVCCPYNDYDVALFDKSIQTTFAGSYDGCDPFKHHENQKEHTKFHMMSDIYISNKLKALLGNDIANMKKNLLFKLDGYKSEKKLHEWKLFDRFINMSHQLYYFVNIWDMRWFDWLGNLGISTDIYNLILNDLENLYRV